jgi:hypothetical protein
MAPLPRQTRKLDEAAPYWTLLDAKIAASIANDRGIENPSLAV